MFKKPYKSSNCHSYSEKVNSIHNGKFVHFLIKGLRYAAIAPLSPRRKVRNSCWPRPAAGRLFAGRAGGAGGIPIPRDLKRDKGWIGICWSCGWAPAQAVNPSRISPRWASS
jgi:hypothetical protein